MAQPRRLLTPRQERNLLTRIDASGVCWEWTGGQNGTGYGKVWITARNLYPHRVMWEWLVGWIPDELEIDHLCRNRLCCNPDHMELVTPRVNTLRGDAMGARRARQTACIHGHPFDEANTYWRRTGGRTCKRCTRERRRSRSHGIRELRITTSHQDPMIHPSRPE
jgi:hypothetical protein